MARRGRLPDSVRPGVGAILSLARQGLLLARSLRALRWRLETFGLYMPSLPESRPWWRVNAVALRALVGQLPGYARWLGEIEATRRAGGRGYWRARSGATLDEWEAWLDRG